MKRAQLLAAYGQTVPALPDVIARDLRVLFCGINPSLYSAVVGHHFARPSNRFWKTLHRAGFTPRVLAPSEDRALLQSAYGLTNLVARATASAAELDDEELRQGRENLAAKVRRYRPRAVALLGIIGAIIWIIAVISILINENYSQGLYDFQLGIMRWHARLLGYHASLVERYPPFALDTGTEAGPEAAGPAVSQPPSA